MARKTKGVDFERALAELEALVESMEEGDLSLEESLKAYERGMQLSRACQQALDEAESRIQILAERDGETKPVPFEDQDEG